MSMNIDRMISKMARMFPIFIGMGFMLVVISFIIGFVNSQIAASYFAVEKSVRETTLMSDRALFESIGQWLPYFKFLGVGMILSGIVMALRVIIDNLRDVGDEVLSNLPEADRPNVPSPPWYAMLMPLTMMIGMLIFIVAFIWAGLLAFTVSSVFSNPLPTIDAAAAGTTLLSQLQHITSANAWLVPLKFFAIATEFVAIAIGLTTIIYILTAQTDVLEEAILIGSRGGSS